MCFSRRFLPLAVSMALLVSPGVAMGIFWLHSRGPAQSIVSVLVSVVIFLIPVVLFHKNIRLYFYLLLPLAVITPLLVFSTLYLAIPPGFELIAFILQTNPREAREAAGPFLVYMLGIEIICVTVYCYAVRRLHPAILPLKQSIYVSVISLSILAAVTMYSNGIHDKPLNEITRRDLFLKYEYPFSLAFAVKEARSYLKRNNIDKARDFSFRAVKNDTISQRRVCVLIIGESSRYDRWQINGYERRTSPRLALRRNLLTYSDVVAGAHYTWVSVPQIITRANPDNYDIQYREKSILAAFKEAGFNTYWLSNQSDQDIFWTGTITLHARTADFYSFSPTYSPNMEYETIYDGRLLPLVDSVLRADKNNLFIVLHTMGNHWEYSQRYPQEFDVFQPSGHTEDINPPNAEKRQALLNSYDNSILYADYIIDSVINMVNRAGVSTVTFVSDHGEDLFDADPDKADFHFRPSRATLRVPLFVWASDPYRKVFPDKWRHLEANLSSKIGIENLFHTVVDMANIRMDAFDSTRSIAHPAFIPSAQKFYDDDNRARLFIQLQ